MLIRKLSPEDAATLQACRLFGLSESPEAFLVSYREVEGTPLSQIQRELQDPDIHYLGAFLADELIGFMRYVRAARQSRRHTAEVRSVYVKKALRGQGIGASLLLRLIEDARAAGIRSLVLSVLADNSAARRLYETAGFTAYGTEPQAIRKDGRFIDQTLYWLDLEARS